MARIQGDQSSQSREDLLLERYRAVGWMPGGELRLRQPDALHFIDDCETLGLVILGMDFYVEKDRGITQLSSTDWGTINHGPYAVGQTVSAARQLIKDGLPDRATWVSFVIEGRENGLA